MPGRGPSTGSARTCPPRPDKLRTMPLSFPAERQSIIDAAQLLIRTGVLSHSNHGNSSVRLPDGQSMLITGVSSLSNPTPETLAALDLDGNLIDGQLASTSAE